MSNRIAVMSAGHVQQIGTPRDIYESPDNRFVADFIGETNLIEVDVEAVAGGQAQVVLPGGHRVTTSAATTDKGRHNLSIRPERVTLVAPGTGLQAVVEQVIYLGTDLQVLVRLDGGTAMQVRLQNAARIQVPTPGTRVGLHLEEGASRLLAD